MARSHRRGNSSATWPIVNRLAQYNVALAICLTGMIRLSMSFSDSQGERPDPFVVLGFFAVMAMAVVFVLYLRKEMQRLRKRWQRVVTSVGSFAIQLIVLEILILLVAE